MRNMYSNTLQITFKLFKYVHKSSEYKYQPYQMNNSNKLVSPLCMSTIYKHDNF